VRPRHGERVVPSVQVGSAAAAVAPLAEAAEVAPQVPVNPAPAPASLPPSALRALATNSTASGPTRRLTPGADALAAGGIYINLCTIANPDSDGEIRGQVTTAVSAASSSNSAAAGLASALALHLTISIASAVRRA
jgi:hypothetical protein